MAANIESSERTVHTDIVRIQYLPTQYMGGDASAVALWLQAKQAVLQTAALP